MPSLRVLPIAALSCVFASPAVLAQQSGEPVQRSERASQSHPSSVRDLLRQMEGQWDGKVQARRDGATSVSVVSASFKSESNGKSIVGCFEGFAFGQHFQGAAVWSDRPSQGVRCTWHDSFSNVVRQEQLVSQHQDGLFMLMSGEPYSNPAQRHVARFDENGRLIVEWLEVLDDGTTSQTFRMTLNRLPQGELAGANDLFRTSESLERVQGRTATAQVPE